MTIRDPAPVDATARPPLLAVRDVHAAYGQSRILRGVSLTIAEGETVGLMGRNGMGKSTLIRTIMGLVPTLSGQVLVAGRDTRDLRTHARAGLGLAYVPEGRGIFATLSVGENLEIAARPAADGRADWTVRRVLDLFPRLAQRLTNRGDELSGGEQQMLAVGRALVTNPRLLLLDEATEGLAPLVREEIWRTIRHVRETGIATLVVDKTVAEVTRIADRVIILVKGEVVHEGPPATLDANPDLMHRHLGV